MNLKLPASVEVELDYPYLENPVVYTFPLRQKRDAELEERERLLGQGKKIKPANRLAALVEDVKGFEALGLDSRREGEDIVDFRNRVAEFFSSEDGQELAEHAILYRGLAVSPQSKFRGGPNSSVAEHIRSEEANRSIPVLSNVHTAGTKPEGGMPDVPSNEADEDAQAKGPG